MRAAFLSALVIAIAAPAQAEVGATPDSYPAERYAKMRETSPFALATPAAEAPAPKAAAFTEGMFLGGHGVFTTASGVDLPMVSIRSKDGREHFTLEGTEPNESGISIASYEPSPVIGESKVILKKGNEFGTVIQDKAGMALAATQAAAQSEAQSQRPNGKPLPPSNRSARTISIPRPNTAPQGQIAPPPPAANSRVNAGPAQTGAAVPPPRARVRVIRSNPGG